MDSCGTQYYNDLTLYFLLALIPVTVLAISLLWIKRNRKIKKKTTPFVISASVSALLAVFPITAFV